MIIVLSKEENPELAELGLRKLFEDPNQWDQIKDKLFWQTAMDNEELRLVIDIYVKPL